MPVVAQQTSGHHQGTSAAARVAKPNIVCDFMILISAAGYMNYCLVRRRSRGRKTHMEIQIVAFGKTVNRTTERQEGTVDAICHIQEHGSSTTIKNALTTTTATAVGIGYVIFRWQRPRGPIEATWVKRRWQLFQFTCPGEIHVKFETWSRARLDGNSRARFPAPQLTPLPNETKHEENEILKWGYSFCHP